MKYESNEEKIFCNMNPRKKCNSLIWISLLQCFLSSSKLYNQIGEHYWRVCHSLQSCHTAQKLDRREYRARYELRLAPKMDHSYNTLPHFWTFSDPPTYALSFYRSQNVLGWSKMFVSKQKFGARQKYDLHSVNLFYVLAQKFLKRH